VNTATDQLDARLKTLAAAVEQETAGVNRVGEQVAALRTALDSQQSEVVGAVNHATRTLRAGMAEDRDAVQGELQTNRRTLAATLDGIRQAVETYEARRTPYDGMVSIPPERRTLLESLRGALGRRTDPRGQPVVPASTGRPTPNGSDTSNPGERK
jgi:hypothetical protein